MRPRHFSFVHKWVEYGSVGELANYVRPTGLAEALAASDMSGREVMFVGFGDDEKAKKENRKKYNTFCKTKYLCNKT